MHAAGGARRRTRGCASSPRRCATCARTCSSPTSNIRSIVVTSPDGSHGKTTVAFGLAATLARAGTRTLLVDADLRRGRVAELLALPRSPGLMDVLLGEAPLEKAIRATSRRRSTSSSAAAARRDPGELLTQAFPALLDRLEREYEAVDHRRHAADPDQRRADRRALRRRDGARRARRAPRRAARCAPPSSGLELISVKPTAAVLNHSGERQQLELLRAPDRERRRPPVTPGVARRKRDAASS